MNYLYYESPLGYLKIIAINNKIVKISFVQTIKPNNVNSFLLIVAQQLDLYFLGKLTKFNVQTKQECNNFQDKVYKILQKTQMGKKYSYKDLAHKIHSKAYRVIGSTMKKNQIPIIVPCHRIINNNGNLSNYASGLHLKTSLLNLESGNFNWFKLYLNKIDFSKILDRCKNYFFYQVYKNGVSYIFKNQRINIIYSHKYLYVNFKDLEIKDVKNDVIYRFGLDINMKSVLIYFKNTSFFNLINKFKNYREIYNQNLYLVLIVTIIHQFVSMQVAFNIIKKIMIKFGEKIDGLYSFPSYRKINSIKEYTFRKMGLSLNKILAIKKVTKLLIEQKIDLNLDQKNITSQLLNIKGIGIWTIENFLIFGKRDLNVFPMLDLGLKKGMQKYLKIKNFDQMPKILKKINNQYFKFKTFITINIWKLYSEIK